MANDTLQVSLKMKEMHDNVCNVTDNFNTAWLYQGYSKISCVYKSTAYLTREEAFDCCLSISFQVCLNRKHVCAQSILCSKNIFQQIIKFRERTIFHMGFQKDRYGKTPHHRHTHTYIWTENWCVQILFLSLMGHRYIRKLWIIWDK